MYHLIGGWIPTAYGSRSCKRLLKQGASRWLSFLHYSDIRCMPNIVKDGMVTLHNKVFWINP